tara:strand:+ start:791 stop:1714 length:924 start_codon:yes stop_codon:yes gene_type:complete
MTYINNLISDFYDPINNFTSNPFVLLILIIILIFYYIIFAFLGSSSNENSEKNSAFVFFESILMTIVIVLIFTNALAYFYNINIIEEIKKFIQEYPKDEIIDYDEDTSFNNIQNTRKKNNQETNTQTPINTEESKKEVYHIPGNNFTYHDAKAVCKAFNSELATFEDLQKSQKKGASWCSYGWSQDKLALYPTSEYDWKKLQKTSDKKYACGLPGINGGYLDNPYAKLGANCFGIKPYKSKLELEILKDKNNLPKSEKELLFNKRVDYWKERIGNVLVYPFNNKNWYMISDNKEFADVQDVSDISGN